MDRNPFGLSRSSLSRAGNYASHRNRRLPNAVNILSIAGVAPPRRAVSVEADGDRRSPEGPGLGWVREDGVAPRPAAWAAGRVAPAVLALRRAYTWQYTARCMPKPAKSVHSSSPRSARSSPERGVLDVPRTNSERQGPARPTMPRNLQFGPRQYDQAVIGFKREATCARGPLFP